MANQRENSGRQDKRGRDYEQRGLVTDVIVPIAGSAAGGAVGGATAAWVTDKMNQGKTPPSDGGREKE